MCSGKSEATSSTMFIHSVSQYVCCHLLISVLVRGLKVTTQYSGGPVLVLCVSLKMSSDNRRGIAGLLSFCTDLQNTDLIVALFWYAIGSCLVH